MIAAILRVYYVLVQKAGQTAAIWSCREDVIAILVGQATMIRPLFTKRFWGMTNSSGSSSRGYWKKDSGKSHELSDNVSKPSRLGMRDRKPKDPYNVSVLETRNESEERIVARDGQMHETHTIHERPSTADAKDVGLNKYPSSGAGRPSNDDRMRQNINIERTVDVQSVASDIADPKPNYGHNSRVHSKWHAF